MAFTVRLKQGRMQNSDLFGIIGRVRKTLETNYNIDSAASSYVFTWKRLHDKASDAPLSLQFAVNETPEKIDNLMWHKKMAMGHVQWLLVTLNIDSKDDAHAVLQDTKFTFVYDPSRESVTIECNNPTVEKKVFDKFYTGREDLHFDEETKWRKRLGLIKFGPRMK